MNVLLTFAPGSKWTDDYLLYWKITRNKPYSIIANTKNTICLSFVMKLNKFNINSSVYLVIRIVYPIPPKYSRQYYHD